MLLHIYVTSEEMKSGDCRLSTCPYCGIEVALERMLKTYWKKKVRVICWSETIEVINGERRTIYETPSKIAKMLGKNKKRVKPFSFVLDTVKDKLKGY